MTENTQPEFLTRADFDTQVQAAFTKHGAAAFVAYPDQPSECALFVQGIEMQVVTQADPRHRYSIFCELAESVAEQDMAQSAEAWLSAGEAYEHYIGLIACYPACGT